MTKKKDTHQKLPEQAKRKRSKTELLSLLLKEYANHLIFIGIPLLIFLLQIMQVWAETAEGRFTALCLKRCMELVLIFCTGRKLWRRWMPKKQPEKETCREALADGKHNQQESSAMEREEILPPAEAQRGETRIPQDMQIHGDVESEKHLSIFGFIEGNVYCKGDIKLYGKVNGNIRCQNLYIDRAELEGDIHCKEMIYLSPKSIVVGDIVAWRMLHKGYIKGNAFVRESVRLEKSSYLVRDVTSMEIEVEEGASIQGRMRIEAIPEGMLSL